jgi:prepilin peptidase CpaA
MWNAFVLAFAITAAIWDIWTRRIPNVLTTSALVAGLIYNAYMSNLGQSLLGCIVGLVAGIALFHLGAVGGGDVKLVGALGAMLGFEPWLTAMFVAIFVAGLVALVRVIHRRLLGRTLWNMLDILKNLFTHGFTAHPEVHVNNPSIVRSPFGVAAAVGTLAVVARLL